MNNALFSEEDLACCIVSPDEERRFRHKGQKFVYRDPLGQVVGYRLGTRVLVTAIRQEEDSQ